MTPVKYNKERLFLWIVILFAILVRVLWLSDYLKTDAFPFEKDGDSHAFFEKAQDVVAGDLFRKDLNLSWPFYVYFLGGLLKLFSGNVFPVLVIQQLLGVANCALVYFIGKKIFSEAAGLVAGLLCSAYFCFPLYECMLMYTSLSVFLVSLLFLLMLDLQDTLSVRKYLFAGFIFGITVLTQANALLFGFPAIAWVLWGKRWGLSKTLRYFLLFFAGFLSVVFAQIVRDSIAHGSMYLGPRSLGVNFYIGNNPKAGGVYTCLPDFTYTQRGLNVDSRAIARGTLGRDLNDSEISGFWAAKALDFIRSNPALYARLLYKKFRAIFSAEEFIVENEWDLSKDGVRIAPFLLGSLKWILPFACLGMIFSIGTFRKVFLLFWALAVFIFSMLLFFVIAKHRLLMIPFLAIFAGYGATVFLDRFKQKRFRTLGFISVFLVGTFFLFDYDLRTVKENSPHYRRLLWSRERLTGLRSFLSQSRYREALEGLAALERAMPGDRFVAFDEGVALFSMGDLSAAEVKFKKAIGVFPYYVEALYNLGLIYNKEGRYQEAETTLSKAAFLDPEDMGVPFERALSLKSFGRREEAKLEFRKCLAKLNRWRTVDIAVAQKELSDLEKESL